MLKNYICHGDCEEYLQSFINSMCEAFALHEIICDDEGNPCNYSFLAVNHAFLEVTGLTMEAVMGKTVLDVYPGLEGQWIELYGRVALSGTSLQFERYFTTLGRHFKISAFSPVKGQFITLFSDITEFKKADAALKKHQILFENAQDIVLYAKPDGSIIDANKNALYKYGYSYDALLLLSIQDISDPSVRDRLDEQMKMADTTGVVFESIHVKKDGTSFPVEVSAKSTVIEAERVRIHIIRDITERKRAEERIVYLANYDSLTGIANRSYLMQQFDTTIEQAVRGNFKFAIMLLDVNRFKTINDTYGHNAGDKVLKETADRIKNSVRKVDTIGRLGGDEFIIIQPFIKGKKDVSALVQRILKEFEAPVELDDGTKFNISISLGISLYPDDAEDAKNLIHRADTAMYKAKQKGGNRFEVYVG